MNNNLIDQDYTHITHPVEKTIIRFLFKILYKVRAIQLSFDSEEIVEKSKLRFAPPRLWSWFSILKNPRLRLPEAFVDGKFHIYDGDILNLILSFNKNNSFFLKSSIRAKLSHIYKQQIKPFTLRETKKHYNEDHKIYKKIIGESLIYSCAFFDKENYSLELAQKNKIYTTLSRLGDLDNDSYILDIGCGWVISIFETIEKTSAKYDGISIAKNQIDYANEKRSLLLESQK